MLIMELDGGIKASYLQCQFAPDYNRNYTIIGTEGRLENFDMDKVIEKALDKVQNHGIVFLDEIDKISGRESKHGPDVSRGGVQRDILPIIEGTSVQTKYGMVKTDHILGQRSN